MSLDGFHTWKNYVNRMRIVQTQIGGNTKELIPNFELLSRINTWPYGVPNKNEGGMSKKPMVFYLRFVTRKMIGGIGNQKFRTAVGSCHAKRNTTWLLKQIRKSVRCIHFLYHIYASQLGTLKTVFSTIFQSSIRFSPGTIPELFSKEFLLFSGFSPWDAASHKNHLCQTSHPHFNTCPWHSHVWKVKTCDKFRK